MPRIIRSTGVNIQSARPVVVPKKAPAKPGPISAPPHAGECTPAPGPARDAAAVRASADTIVEEMLDRARNDADHMLVNARAETIRVLQEALQEGREQGFAEAMAEWEALRGEYEAEFEGAIAALKAERERAVAELEQGMLDLVFDIAEKVLSVEMDRTDAWVESMVKEALGELEGGGSVVLKVSADARRRVTDAAERLMLMAGKPQSGLSVQADSSLPPGGCVIETERGVIDNSAELKLGRLKAVLQENA